MEASLRLNMKASSTLMWLDSPVEQIQAIFREVESRTLIELLFLINIFGFSFFFPTNILNVSAC